MINEIKDITTELLEKLYIKYDNIEVEQEVVNIFRIKIKTEDSGIIIGSSGKTLEVIRMMLSVILSRKYDKKIRLHIEVNDYLEQKDNKLFDFIKSKITVLKRTGKEIKLPFLSAYDRKKVHGFVSELGYETICTRSEGEGKERRMYLYKKEKVLTIDLDGIDI